MKRIILYQWIIKRIILYHVNFQFVIFSKNEDNDLFTLVCSPHCSSCSNIFLTLILAPSFSAADAAMTSSERSASNRLLSMDERLASTMTTTKKRRRRKSNSIVREERRGAGPNNERFPADNAPYVVCCTYRTLRR